MARAKSESVEHQLERTLENLEFALQSGGMGTWDIDLKTNQLTCSKEMLELWNVTAEEFGGNRAILQKRVHPDDVEKMRAGINAAIADREVYELSYRIFPKPEVERWVYSRGRCLYDDNSHEPIRFAGVVYDITKNKMAEQDLQKAKHIAEQANLAKSQFLANMSHELRTPVGVISGFIDLMKNHAVSDEERAEYMEIVARNSQNLMRLIDDILDLSKIEAGRIDLEKVELDLPAFLADFKTTMDLKASEKGIAFELDIVEPIPNPIFTDPLRLRQILSNLAGNAVKFTYEGCVRLRIKYGPPKLQFEVSDSGPGVADENINKLFQPFGQVDPQLTRKHGGTGLGLVLARRLAEALGGAVTLEKSEVGKGSVFVASIDVGHVSTQATKAFVRKPRTENLSGLRVLLVEDVVDNRKLITAYLHEAGAKVEVAVDGVDGVQKAIATVPDVVLMDIRMPRLDGREATRQLRLAGFSNPIIAVTAHAMRDERDRCLQAGCTDFLTKPIDRHKLIEILLGYANQ